MESIERLREFLRHVAPIYVDRENIHICRFDTMLDAIEAEVAERYMKLPEDADGVPIRIGDTIENWHVSIGPIDAICFMGNGEWEVYKNGNSWVVSGEERHVKPRTVEDVLHDFAIACEDAGFKGPDVTRLIREYSDELQMKEES